MVKPESVKTIKINSGDGQKEIHYHVVKIDFGTIEVHLDRFVLPVYYTRLSCLVY